MKIGVVVMLRHLQELGRAPQYSEVRERALQAEAAGFDALWLYDHLLYRGAGQPTVGAWECWTMLAGPGGGHPACRVGDAGAVHTISESRSGSKNGQHH